MSTSLVRLVPSGWFDQNKLSLCRLQEDDALALRKDSDHRVGVHYFGAIPHSAYGFLSVRPAAPAPIGPEPHPRVDEVGRVPEVMAMISHRVMDCSPVALIATVEGTFQIEHQSAADYPALAKAQKRSSMPVVFVV